MAFVITRNRLPAAMAALEHQVSAAVEKVAHEVQADAQQRAPYDTGFLRGSAYARQSSRFVWRVGFSAHYAIYVELGTSRMRAQPYLMPAWVAGRYKLMQALRRIGVFG